MEPLQTVKRQPYWDCVKGCAIVSVVLGHGFQFAHSFVYSYHLALFFFISGWFYNEEKYGDHPDQNFAARVKTNWPKFVIYSSILTMLHFALQGFLGSGMLNERYTVRTAVNACFEATLFRIKDLTGAMWFVPQIIFASTLFGIIVWFSRRSYCCKYKNAVIVGLSLLCGLFGSFVNHFEIELAANYHLELVLKAVPIYTLSYYCKKSWNREIRGHLRLSIALICFLLILTACLLKVPMGINADPVSFYGLGIAGIYLMLFLCQYIEKNRFSRSAFSVIGSYSFEIMAWHFLLYFLFNAILSRIGSLHLNPFSLNDYQQFGAIQLPIILGVPCLIGAAYKKARKIIIR